MAQVWLSPSCAEKSCLCTWPIKLDVTLTIFHLIKYVFYMGQQCVVVFIYWVTERPYTEILCPSGTHSTRSS